MFKDLWSDPSLSPDIHDYYTYVAELLKCVSWIVQKLNNRAKNLRSGTMARLDSAISMQVIWFCFFFPLFDSNKIITELKDALKWSRNCLR